MRKMIGLFILLYSMSAQAGSLSIQVEKYLKTDMDFIFEIKNKKFERIVLDCQGFINGVTVFGHQDERELLVLDIGECEDIHVQIIQGIEEEKPVCLKLNFEARAYRVDHTLCS